MVGSLVNKKERFDMLETIKLRNVSMVENKASFTVNIDRHLSDDMKVMVKRHLHASLQDLSDKIQQAMKMELLEYQLECADSVKTHLESVIDLKEAVITRLADGEEIENIEEYEE